MTTSAVAAHPTTMIIRRIEPADLGHLLGLYHQLHPDEPPPAEGALREVWPQLLADARVIVFVGEAEATLVATCTLSITPNLTRGARPYGLIENVVTSRAYRRRGLGTTMMRHALEYAWEAGCYKVMLLTGSAREQTLRFYEGVGFRRGLKAGLVAHAPSR